MAKYNEYRADATDDEGETILADERFHAMSDEGAWAEAVKRAFGAQSKKRKDGYLVGRLAELRVMMTYTRGD